LPCLKEEEEEEEEIKRIVKGIIVIRETQMGPIFFASFLQLGSNIEQSLQIFCSILISHL
jgi:hypothetical protein